MTDEKAQAIIAVEARRREALVALDMAALDQLFADDLIHVHSTGMVHDKPTLLRHVETRRQFLRVDRGELDVRFYGETALLTGPMTNLMRKPDGDTFVMQGFTSQLLRQGPAGWRFHFFQFTLDKPA